MRSQFPAAGRDERRRAAGRARRRARGASGSTRSSCPRAATGRCCASCRSASAARSRCSTRSRASTPRRSPTCSPTPASQVVLHAGRQDVAIMRREWRTDVTNVFDTQVAAGFAGFAAQAGYTGLLHDVLKIRVAKTASFTRWDARPLTQEQLVYAREDVEHLLPLADEIQKRLLSSAAASSGRARSAARSPTRATSATPRRSGAGCRAPRGLDPRERAVARELGRLARAHGDARGPPGRLDRARPDAGRARQAPARRAGATWARSAGSTRRWCAAAAPTCSRPSSAAARRRRSASRRPSACRRSPSTDRRSRSRRRWCVRGRRRPGWPTS